MNPELQQRIAAIKAECEGILKLSEKATPGPMKAGTKGFTIGRLSYTPKNVGTLDIPVTELDLALIAHSRNVSPAMARVVLAAIDFLERQSMSETCADEAHGCNHPQDASELLESIADQWEGK